MPNPWTIIGWLVLVALVAVLWLAFDTARAMRKAAAPKNEPPPVERAPEPAPAGEPGRIPTPESIP